MTQRQKVNRIVHVRPEQPSEEALAHRDTVLALLGHAQRSMGETTHQYAHRRSGIEHRAVTAAIKALLDQGMIRVHRVTLNETQQYHLTAKGWDKLGQQPPIWAAA